MLSAGNSKGIDHALPLLFYPASAYKKNQYHASKKSINKYLILWVMVKS